MNENSQFTDSHLTANTSPHLTPHSSTHLTGLSPVKSSFVITKDISEINKTSKTSGKGVLIIGLGRFGSAVAQTLDSMGEDVLCVDSNPKLVQFFSSQFPCVEADVTDPAALEQVGVEDFATAVVGIGNNIEASVLIAGNLLDIGVGNVWAKAVTAQHHHILERIGVHHIVNPERDSGNRVGHLVSGKLIDYIQIDEDFTIVKMFPPKDVQGFTLEQSKIRSKYGVTILGTKTPGEEIEAAAAGTRILAGDTIVVAGSPELIERFARKN